VVTGRRAGAAAADLVLHAAAFTAAGTLMAAVVAVRVLRALTRMLARPPVLPRPAADETTWSYTGRPR
jgi:hypothetical protein